MNLVSIGSLYENLGKEDGIRQLVDTFYDYMDSEEFAAGIRAMHAEDLTEARQKLYEFLVGWCGGPPLYQDKYGHPRLRARHMPFPIAESERDQWMHCMRLALQKCVSDEKSRQYLDERFFQIADFMRNQE